MCVRLDENLEDAYEALVLIKESRHLRILNSALETSLCDTMFVLSHARGIGICVLRKEAWHR